MHFQLLSILLSLICVGLGYLCFKPRLGAKYPRAKLPGVLLGLPCLAWSAWHGCLMLEGPLASLHPFVWALVPIGAILCYCFLDYLAARATGGFFILAANELIRCAFGGQIALRPIHSVICLLLGIAGMFMLGTPWRLRDMYELAERKPGWGKAIFGILLVMAVLVTVLSFTCKK